MKRSPWIIFGCILGIGLFPSRVQADLRVHGRLQLNQEWERMVYVSVIPDLKALYAVSNANIVMWGPIDSTGNFDLSADYLPAEAQLYRIHVVKQGDPAATITIGGQEENFLFLTMGEGSEVHIQDQGQTFIWGDARMEGGEANAQLHQVQEWVRAYETQREQGFSLGNQYLREALHSKLRNFADTTAYALVGLYALYQTPYQRHSQKDPAYYQTQMGEWGDEESAYLAAFRQSLSLPTTNSNWAGWSQILCLLIGGGVGWLLRMMWHHRRQARPAAEVDAHGYPQLSIQERNIFEHLRQGKSTKEIAHELSIEPSTVKSHIQRIYRKLNINSRREAMDYQLPG
ncbi:MAG: helix-turn-helix transcriptional regulator [Bacteroidota bacterium]